jgi:hypothetical protein
MVRAFGSRRELRNPTARASGSDNIKPMSGAGPAREFLRAVSLLLLWVMSGILAALSAQSQNSENSVTTTTRPHPVLVELFTSEGCSSCPPADLMIRKLDELQPIPGAQLIVLSEHVTYWDHDGWKDPNSSPALTDRQTAYEGALGEKEPFTPQIIVDGTQEVHLNHPHEMEDILRKAEAAAKVPVRIGEITMDGASPSVLRAHIETDTNFDKHGADVFVAVALDHVESQVLRGENGGKHLVHVAVVQQLTKIGKLAKGKSFAQDIELKLKPGTDPKNLRLIAFVQEAGPGKLLGAALQKRAS